jgi:hypothetical protein
MGITYDGSGGSTPTTGDGTSSGGTYQGDYGANSNAEYQAEVVRQDLLANTPNTVAPTVVSLPIEHFNGDANTIFDAYGTDLDSVENPYKPYITGYTEDTISSSANGGTTVTVYNPVYEYSDAYFEFETALSDAKTREKVELDAFVNSSVTKVKEEDYNVNLLTAIATIGTTLFGTTPPPTANNMNNIGMVSTPMPDTGGISLLKLQKKTDNWKITFDFSYISSPFDDYFSKNYSYVGSQIIVKNSVDASSNDWMAGGKLYDSPRAGGAYFNETGDLNTVRFLGLQDRNYNGILSRKLSSTADVFKILGVTAGARSIEDDNALAKLYQSRISAQLSGSVEQDANEHGEVNNYVPTYPDPNDCKYSAGDKDMCAVNEYLESGLGEDLANLDNWVSDSLTDLGGTADDLYSGASDFVSDVFGGGCFITTATLNFLQTDDDDCSTLTLIRNWRDSWLAHQEDGKELIAFYYEIAPKIVKAIGQNETEYKNIYTKYLLPFKHYIENGENIKAKELYILMVKDLQERYLF